MDQSIVAFCYLFVVFGKQRARARFRKPVPMCRYEIFSMLCGVFVVGRQNNFLRFDARIRSCVSMSWVFFSSVIVLRDVGGLPMRSVEDRGLVVMCVFDCWRSMFGFFFVRNFN